jgi:serine protease inhibitor
MLQRFLAFGALALVAIAFLFSGCVSPNPPPTPLQNHTFSPNNSVVEGNSRFAMDIYSKYRGEAGNIFLSPFSISTALAMTYEGADGTTAKEMSSVLHLPGNDTTRREGYAALLSKINAERNESVLRSANALWLQKDQPLLDGYTQDIAQYYGGYATLLDFRADAEGSRTRIN